MTRIDCRAWDRAEARRRLGLVSTAEACAGWCVSATTLRALRRAGVLHTVVPSGVSRPVLYRTSELDAWVAGEAVAR